MHALQSPPPVYSFSAFNKLPNHGIYCIHVKASQGHKSNSSRVVTHSELLKRSEARHKRGTLDFLQETLKYIENIRKPQVVEEAVSARRLVRVRRKPRKSPIRTRPVSLQPSYSVKYVGEVEGRLSVLTTRVPLLPTSPKAKTPVKSEIRLPTAFVPKAKGHRWSLDFSSSGRYQATTPTEEAPRKELMAMESFAPRQLRSEEPREDKVIRWESFADLERQHSKHCTKGKPSHSRRINSYY